MMSVLLFCAMNFAPPLGMTALLFSPTPLALLGAREGKAWMAAGLLAAAVLVGFLSDASYIVYFLLGQGFLCFGLTLPLGKVKTGGESLLFCTVISIVSKLILLALAVSLTGQNPFAVDPNELRTMLARMYSGMVLQGQEAAFFREAMEQAVAVIPYMAPSFIPLLSMLDSFLNYRLCEALQRRYDAPFAPLPPFREWRFPKSLLWALMFAFLLPHFTGGERGHFLWIMLGINLKFLVLMFFFLQGISLAWWGLSRLTKRFLLRLIVMMLFVFPTGILLPVALGIGDACFDFRRKKAG